MAPITPPPAYQHCRRCGIPFIGPVSLCASCGSCPRCHGVVTGGTLCRDCNPGLPDHPPPRPAA